MNTEKVWQNIKKFIWHVVFRNLLTIIFIAFRSIFYIMSQSEGEHLQEEKQCVGPDSLLLTLREYHFNVLAFSSFDF